MPELSQQICPALAKNGLSGLDVICHKCELAQVPQCRRCRAPLPAKPKLLPPVLTITLRQAERNLIELTLARHPVLIAAKLLGVSRRTLSRKIKAHGLRTKL